MEQPSCDVGMVGLGVMGRNLALQWAEHGYRVAGYDMDSRKIALFEREGEWASVQGARDLPELVALLREPRVVMMLVPAGEPVDAVIRAVSPYLTPGDILIDGGNSHFIDTNARAAQLEEQGLLYLGVGISGGEEGARHGASIMPGGPPEAYQRVWPLLEAVAAEADGQPCVAYLGPGSAGHYVKMVHNGIEYALMQLIAETYDLMKRGLRLADDQLAEVYEQWNDDEFHAYLLEITANIFRTIDNRTGKPLVDVVLDQAAQKGTGAWTSEDALQLQVPVPTIDVAVATRALSWEKSQREAASRLLGEPARAYEGDKRTFISQLHDALSAATIIVFAQGFALLKEASRVYGYQLDLAEVARIWRAGCIIRTAFLEDIAAAFRQRPELPNLLFDPRLAARTTTWQVSLRGVVATAAMLGLPVPALMASLAYYDTYRSAWIPANLIQAQRDYFGAHSYQRIDAKGTFHTHWAETRKRGAEEEMTK